MTTIVKGRTWQDIVLPGPPAEHSRRVDPLDVQHPLNLRGQKRATASLMTRQAKAERVAITRADLRLQAATPRPSRGFFRRLIANANRQAELAASMARHPAGSLVAA